MSKLVHVFNSPLFVQVGLRKKFMLNLNKYRNAHFRELSKAKNNYTATMAYQIQKSPKFERCSIEYIVYPQTKRKFDLGNVVAIHKKFFEDAMIVFKKLPDDDYLHVVSSSESFGGIDKDYPRVEITITEVEDDGSPIKTRNN